MDHVIGDRSGGLATILAGQLFVSLFSVTFLLLFFVFRAENRLKAGSYRLNLEALPEEVSSDIRQTLQSLGLDFSRESASYRKMVYAWLFRTDAWVYKLQETGLRIIVEHHPPLKGVKEEDTTSVFVCPSGESTQSQIIRFIEAYNALGRPDEHPELVMWSLGSRRPPANTGEGFNSSSNVTSDAEEEVR
jgi:hypothetical protein